MDFNEFSFEALFKCKDFCFCDSPELDAADREFIEALENNICDKDTYNHLEYTAVKCCDAAQKAGFEQGFRFAVKLMRRLYDMSFSEMPPVI